MRGTKGGEAVSSAAGISLCDAPLWCGLVCDYRMRRRLSRTRLFYGCPLLRSRIFPFFLYVCHHRQRRRRARGRRVWSARAARGRARAAQGARPTTTTGRKAHRLDLNNCCLFSLSPLSHNNYLSSLPSHKYNIN